MHRRTCAILPQAILSSGFCLESKWSRTKQWLKSAGSGDPADAADPCPALLHFLQGTQEGKGLWTWLPKEMARLGEPRDHRSPQPCPPQPLASSLGGQKEPVGTKAAACASVPEIPKCRSSLALLMEQAEFKSPSTLPPVWSLASKPQFPLL